MNCQEHLVIKRFSKHSADKIFTGNQLMKIFPSTTQYTGGTISLYI